MLSKERGDELTDICWISLLELGMGNALVMHVYPAWFRCICSGNGTNMSSWRHTRTRRKQGVTHVRYANKHTN